MTSLLRHYYAISAEDKAFGGKDPKQLLKNKATL